MQLNATLALATLAWFIAAGILLLVWTQLQNHPA
jgi:uncharacterized membrane protein (GlpM family)